MLEPPANTASYDEDRDLLDACRAGREDAWASLVTKYERLIYAIPLRMGLTHDDADEVFQDTFAALAQSLDAIRDGRRLAGWLSTVARRHAWHTLRRGRTETTFSDLGDDQDDASVLTLIDTAAALRAPERSATDAAELSMWLDSGLRLLGERCRELLQALYLDPREPAYAAVARALGIPLGSIGPTRARCLEQLKRHLHDE